MDAVELKKACKEGIKIAELSKMTGIYRSTIYRILSEQFSGTGKTFKKLDEAVATLRRRKAAKKMQHKPRAKSGKKASVRAA